MFLASVRIGLEKLFPHENGRPGLVSCKWCFSGGSVVFVSRAFSGYSIS